MEEKKISVIVPVYKVEEYLPRCLDSIINQTYKNLEIILVDDGSPDNCGKICDEYAERDSRIRVIHKENGGLSDARNAGLAVATGEYISFVDSDDWVELDMIEKVSEYAEMYNADIVRYDAVMEYDKENPGITSGKKDNDARLADTVQALKETVYTNVNMSVCNKIFKASIFENERFDVNLYGIEDWEFNYRILKKLKPLTSVYTDLVKYHYFVRNGSITHKWNRDAMKNSFDLFENIYNNEMCDKEIFPYACRGYAQHNISVIRDAILAGQEKTPQVREMVKKIKRKEKNLRKNVKSKSGKLRLMMVCHFFGLYRVYVKFAKNS